MICVQLKLEFSYWLCNYLPASEVATNDKEAFLLGPARGYDRVCEAHQLPSSDLPGCMLNTIPVAMPASLA